MTRIKLTEFETGRPLLVVVEEITVVRPLAAEVLDYLAKPVELGERTQVFCDGVPSYVRETSDEVVAAIVRATGESLTEGSPTG